MDGVHRSSILGNGNEAIRIPAESERSRRILESYCVFIFYDRRYQRVRECLRTRAYLRVRVAACIVRLVGLERCRGGGRAPESYRHSRLDKNSEPGPVTQNWKHFTRRGGRRHVSRIRSNKLRGIGNRRPAQNPIRGPVLPPPLSSPFVAIFFPRVPRAPRPRCRP